MGHRAKDGSTLGNLGHISGYISGENLSVSFLGYPLQLYGKGKSMGPNRGSAPFSAWFARNTHKNSWATAQIETPKRNTGHLPRVICHTHGSFAIPSPAQPSPAPTDLRSPGWRPQAFRQLRPESSFRSIDGSMSLLVRLRRIQTA